MALIIPTIRMFLYNRDILREEKGGRFHFFERGEQTSLLHSGGFRLDSPEVQVYADQAWMAVGLKRF